MNTDMDENQARQLEKRIKREAPHLNVQSEPVTDMESLGAWTVYIYLPGMNEPLAIDNLSDWELQKKALRLS